jgi:C4-type Zn-finger protein
MKHIIKYQSFLNNLHEGFVANIIKIFAACNRCGYKQISVLFKRFHQQENLHTNREIKDTIGV